MIKILFVASNPKDSSPLRLGEELREVEARLESSPDRSELQLSSLFAARPADLLQHMNKIRPQILHLSGHGSDAGEIILETNDGQAKPVAPVALKSLFESFRPDLQVVLLNACYSAAQASALIEVVDAVIAMKVSIGDAAAITFASSFYSALGFGRSVSDAFKQGTTAILLEGIDEADTPVLFHRPSSDPSKLTLTTSAQLLRSSDPTVPLRLRELMLSGTRLVVVSHPEIPADRLLYFELVLRQSKTTFVVEVDCKNRVGATAETLAIALIPSLANSEYDWELTRRVKGGAEELLRSFHTLEMAGVQSGDRILLVGNHRHPEWAPRR